MADARPTLLHWRSDIRKRKQTQFSRPMTGHTPQKLPRFRAISCIIAVRVFFIREKFAKSPYTRSNMIPHLFPFVKSFFVRNHDFLSKFSFILAMPFSRKNVAADIICHYILRNISFPCLRLNSQNIISRNTIVITQCNQMFNRQWMLTFFIFLIVLCACPQHRCNFRQRFSMLLSNLHQSIHVIHIVEPLYFANIL